MGVGGTQEEEVVVPPFWISKWKMAIGMPAVGVSSRKECFTLHEAIV